MRLLGLRLLFTGKLFDFNLLTSQVPLMVKNPPASVGDLRDVGSIPGSERSPGGGRDNPLLYSCLENQAMVHRVAKNWA